MAEVFKAEYLGDPNVVVAIKRILPQFSQDKKLISMLVNEARLSVGLSHPGGDSEIAYPRHSVAISRISEASVGVPEPK